MNAYQQHHSGIVSLNWRPKLRCLAQNVIAWLVSSRFPALAQYAIIAWLASLLMLPRLDPVCYHCLTLHLDTCFNHGLISKKYNLLDTLFVHSSLMMCPWYPHQRWHQWHTQKLEQILGTINWIQLHQKELPVSEVDTQNLNLKQNYCYPFNLSANLSL